jgi:hypothetical protein
MRRRISPISERARPTWTSPNDSRPARATGSPRKEVEEPLRHAEANSWTVTKSSGCGHSWGHADCPGPERVYLVDSEGPSNHAKRSGEPATTANTNRTQPNRKTTTMDNQEFTIVLRGPIDDKIVDALFEAGCDDATIRTSGALVFADFDREAPTMLEALTSAIRQVRSVGLEVRSVEPGDFVTLSEIAERLGRTRESVRLLADGPAWRRPLPTCGYARRGPGPSVPLVAGG